MAKDTQLVNDYVHTRYYARFRGYSREQVNTVPTLSSGESENESRFLGQCAKC